MKADDSSAGTVDGPLDGLIPDEPQANPQMTIRSKTSGHLVYDIDPEQLPTETISHGGRRMFPDETGALDRIEAVGPSRYEVIEKISEGGMGLVYSVRENSLKREVALKICRTGTKPGQRGSLEVEEFTNEAYMTARLDHPGVVPIYALAKDADGRPFFAMKKVTGIPWKDLLHPDASAEADVRERLQKRARQMTWRDHFEILLKVCDAVAYAHSKSILHRDLKPENVMLGEFGEVYVMDWGLAMYFDERNEYKRFPELKPQLAGTPYYIAPEMVRGEMKSLGPASDIYLLGGILYEILTGRPPHEGKPIMALLRKAAAGDVPPPEEVGDSQLIPPGLVPHRHESPGPPRPGPLSDRAGFPAGPARVSGQFGIHGDQPAGRRAVLRHPTGSGAGFAGSQRNPSTGRSPPSTTASCRSASAASSRRSRCGPETKRPGGPAGSPLPANPAGHPARRPDAGPRPAPAAGPGRNLFRRPCGCGANPDAPAGPRRADCRAAGDPRRAARQMRGWKIAAGAMGLLVLAGLLAIVHLNSRQRALAIQNERKMFAASVASRAQMLEQFIGDIEQVVKLYQQTAVELMACPADQLPYRDRTPAGRDGFYFDEDFYAPETQPPGLSFSKRYRTKISMAHPTVVRSPWARDEAAQGAVNEAAARLARLNSVFAPIHRMRKDIQWSLAGSEAGLLVGFPGFGRYRDQPDYDATRRVGTKPRSRLRTTVRPGACPTRMPRRSWS